jgi:GTPase SAR1 family protein
MEEKILETIVTSFTKTLIDESKELFSDIYDQVYDEGKQFLGKDLKKYLTKQRDKYSHIKTLLKGNTPVYLYDVYYPLKLQNRNGVISTNSISNIFTHKNYITIIGDAGSGKSTLVKHLFLNSILEKYRIPLLIELRYLNDDSRSLENYIKDLISVNKISVNSVILDRLLDKGKFVLFFDGYDELDDEAKKIVTKQLNDFVNKYDSNNYILTSRPYSNIEHFPLFHNLNMKDLSLENGEIKGFIYKQLSEEMEIAEKIIKSIEQGQVQYINSFLKNPLLLTLYILTFQSYASIPDKKHIFYRRVINALFSEHDSKTKLGFVREKLCGLNQEQFENILKVFSFISYFDSQFNFERDYVTHKLSIIKSKHKNIVFDNNKFISDLKSAIALWVDDNGVLAFAHRSLQEYFAALFIKELQAEENKRVYKKIITRFAESKGRPLREVENLLTLLSEMDEYHFYQNYYLPILKELFAYFDKNISKPLPRQFIDFFTDGIRFNQSRRKVGGDKESKDIIEAKPLVKDEIYKTIAVHIDFTTPLYCLISEKYSNNELVCAEHPSTCKIECSGEDDRLKRNQCIIKYNNGISDEFYNILDGPALTEITDNFYNFLENEIKKVTTFLSQVIDIEKDIVDLI